MTAYDLYPNDGYQDLDIQYYRVVITNPGGLSGNRAGFIDDESVVTYMEAQELAGSPIVPPSSLTVSENKVRGNLRYRNIIRQVSIDLNPAIIININKPSANVNTEPTTFDFTIGYDRPQNLVTVDELSVTPPVIIQQAGATIQSFPTLTGAAAIRRYVARGMNVVNITDQVQVYVPSPSLNDQVGLLSEILGLGSIGTDLATCQALVTVTALTVQ